MKLKSYFSGTVEAAMELARQELGDDALLINARPAPPETRAFGAFEVVFGVLPGGVSPGPSSIGTADRESADVQHLRNDVAHLRREIERLAQLLPADHATARNSSGAPPGILSRDPEPDGGLEQRLLPGATFEDLFEVDATLGISGASRQIVTLVGPPGAGKTTTLIKLAARYGVAEGRPVHILSTGIPHIGAPEQLQMLASILGVGCTMAAAPEDLLQALRDHSPQSLILIDTPGFSPGGEYDGADIAQAIRSQGEIDVHLVLPATLSPPDLRRIVGRFEPFQAGKVLFTRIDEASRLLSLISESAGCRLRLSFLGTGQGIPQDLEPATKGRVSAWAIQTGVTQTGATQTCASQTMTHRAKSKRAAA